MSRRNPQSKISSLINDWQMLSHTLLCNSGNVEDAKRLEFRGKSGLDMVGGTGIEPATSGL